MYPSPRASCYSTVYPCVGHKESSVPSVVTDEGGLVMKDPGPWERGNHVLRGLRCWTLKTPLRRTTTSPSLHYYTEDDEGDDSLPVLERWDYTVIFRKTTRHKSPTYHFYPYTQIRQDRDRRGDVNVVPLTRSVTLTFGKYTRDR